MNTDNEILTTETEFNHDDGEAGCDARPIISSLERCKMRFGDKWADGFPEFPDVPL